MPKLRKVAGAWRDVAARHRKVDGQWRRVKESYRKVDGRWVKTMSLPYIEPYIYNTDSGRVNAGTYFDSSTGSYRAYIENQPWTLDGVDVGFKIKGLPENAEINITLSTYEGNDRTTAVSFFTAAYQLGAYNVPSSPINTTYQNINGGEFLMIIRYNNMSTHTGMMNFALHSVKINGVPMPLP